MTMLQDHNTLNYGSTETSSFKGFTGNCGYCGGCTNCDRCSHCGRCKNCGRQVEQYTYYNTFTTPSPNPAWTTKPATWVSTAGGSTLTATGSTGALTAASATCMQNTGVTFTAQL